MAGKPSAKFFEGRTPPDLPIFSRDNLDWHDEMMKRSMEGFEFRGTKFTGDQWFFLNHYKILTYKLDSRGNPIEDFDMMWAMYSQDDDYVFKQFEEARREKMASMLFTGRGFGKTYLVTSIGTKLFYFKDKFDGVISASMDHHAAPTWKKFRDGITALNLSFPTWELELIRDSPDFITSGKEEKKEAGWTKEENKLMESIVYGNMAGKSKGRRLDYQHWEEIGDWGGAATLKECIAASEGTWKVGSVNKCRVFYTGTGGSVTSTQARDIAYNPEAFNIYPVVLHRGKKTCIILTADQKRGGFWESTGESDRVAAKADIMDERAQKALDPEPTVLNKHKQEYPLTDVEMFQVAGGNRFNQEKLTEVIFQLEEFPDKRRGQYGKFKWIYNDKGEKVDAQWIPDENGKMWLLEPRVEHPTGGAWPKLYVGGYDGIDMGWGKSAKNKSKTASKGSEGALSIKKRMLPGAGIANQYVFHFFDRPFDENDFFEGCHQACVYFRLEGAMNVEFSKIAIVQAFRNWGAMKYFMRRPRLTLANLEKIEDNNNNTQIGTTPTAANFTYGESATVNHINDTEVPTYDLRALRSLRDFTMETRGEHDPTMSIFMCEIADGEFYDQLPKKFNPPPPERSEIGYYTDGNGVKRWGEIPKHLRANQQFGPGWVLGMHKN